MTKAEKIYSLTERDYNGLDNAVSRSVSRMIACQDLLEELDDCEAFENTLEGLLEGGHRQKTTLEAQKDNAYKWLKKYYRRLQATHTAISALVYDTRDSREMNAMCTLSRAEGAATPGEVMSE